MKIISLSVQTTGLDPKNDFILEMSMTYLDTETEHKEFLTKLFFYAESLVRDEFAHKIHTENGLIEECIENGSNEIEKFRSFLNEYIGDEDFVLIGTRVSQAVAFIRYYDPILAENLGHRGLDIAAIHFNRTMTRVQSVKEVFAEHGFDLTYRAEPDALCVLEIFRRIMDI